MAFYAAATAAALATTGTLNSALGLTHDIRQLRDNKASGQRIQAWIDRLGSHVTLYHMLELADENAEALWFEGRSWNYRAMKAEVDRIALGFREIGVKGGDFVAVYMTNSPEFVFTVYAIAKLGAAPGLINSALRDETLAHCVKLASSNKIICTPDLVHFAIAASNTLPEKLLCVSMNLGSFQSSRSTEGITLFAHIPINNTSEIVQTPRAVTDVGALIYTSGTTGKPKACSVKNILICITSTPTAADLSNPSKYFPTRTYSCMPLFHGTTFLTGLCYSVGTSGTFCVARKFSASRFFKDISESRATRMLYVGELCRYLVASAPSKYDRKHNCIVATGNGLQRDIWTKFKKRFNVPEIREYYRSTEGLVKFDNLNKKWSMFGAGKVGYAGPIGRAYEGDIFIVKFDYDTEMPYRNPKTGFCIPARLGEPGEAIARVHSFDTYSEYLNNPTATEEKILRNVFAPGDVFQRSGDLIAHDWSGWIRFHDRIGETFRWKGENVSAGEVAAFIRALPRVHDVMVAGKQLKGYDGKAGVAAVTLESAAPEEEAAFIDGLYQSLKVKGVPSYALPRLVVVTSEVAINDTFKHAKQALKNQDWKPSSTVKGSSKYWLDGDAYKPLVPTAWAQIEAGRAKL